MPRKRYKKVNVSKIEYVNNKVKVVKTYTKPTLRKKRVVTKVVKDETGASIGNYAKYKEWYDKQEFTMKKKGLQMAYPRLREHEFHEAYIKVRLDRLDEVSSGNIKNVGNIYQYIVRAQAYHLSYNYGKVLKEYARATGQNVSVEQIRNTPKSELSKLIDFSEVKDKYQALKDLGKNVKEISHALAQEFFGSD